MEEELEIWRERKGIKWQRRERMQILDHRPWDFWSYTCSIWCVRVLPYLLSFPGSVVFCLEPPCRSNICESQPLTPLPAQQLIKWVGPQFWPGRTLSLLDEINLVLNIGRLLEDAQKIRERWRGSLRSTKRIALAHYQNNNKKNYKVNLWLHSLASLTEASRKPNTEVKSLASYNFLK